MSVRCTIQNKNARILGRCVHCLNKLSEEFLYIQVYHDGIILKCVSIACSAFGNFAFGVSFFNIFTTPGPEMVDEKSFANYKISIKGLFHVFKYMGLVDKTVETCIMEFDSKEFITFIFECKYGIVKQFKIPIIELEILRTFCKVDSLPNSITSNSKVLSSAFNIFHKNDDEITMLVSRDTFIFRNYDDGILNLNSSIHTQTALDKTEFFVFDVKKETSLVFCCRELRSILALADQLGQDLEISFGLPGEPILITLKSDKNYEINFILSTIADTHTNDIMKRSFLASPIAAEEHVITDISPPGLAQAKTNDKALSEKQIAFNASLFDFDFDVPFIDDFALNSHSKNKRNSSRISTNNSAFNNSDAPTHSGASILYNDTIKLPDSTQRFREDILTDMITNDDYYDDSIEDAVILAPESDEEQFAL